VRLHARDLEGDTRARLLEAAGEVFAEQGFRSATIREICTRAGANIAAVNYHFRDKEGLYSAVLKHTASVALERYPLGAGVAADAPAAQRLEAFIRNFLTRLLAEGPAALHGRLMAREMVEPTKALDEIAARFAGPQHARLRLIMSELLGPGAADPLIRHCCASVVGQCLFHRLCRPMIQRIMPDQSYDEAGREALVRHITDFSLSAIAAARRRLEEGGLAKGGAKESQP
jgi:AcrR family transcriptional regulator